MDGGESNKPQFERSEVDFSQCQMCHVLSLAVSPTVHGALLQLMNCPAGPLSYPPLGPIPLLQIAVAATSHA